MAKVYIEAEGQTNLRLWTTGNLAMFWQYSYWQSTTKRLQLVPATVYGFAVLTLDQDLDYDPPLAAWAIFRPCALMLEWSESKNIQLRDMDLEFATAWYNACHRQWRHIKLAKR